MCTGQELVFVRADGPGGDGTSWEAALSSPAEAMAVASAGQTVWVAAGVYRAPTAQGTVLEMVHGVEIYGGFPTGGGDGSFEARDRKTNGTALSGDLNGNDGPALFLDDPTRADNAYHVVTADGTSASAAIDGFTAWLSENFIERLDGHGNVIARWATQTDVGDAYESCGEMDRAKEAWTKARVLFEEVGIPDKAQQVQAWIAELEEGQ